jgi:hypothetical protein
LKYEPVDATDRVPAADVADAASVDTRGKYWSSSHSTFDENAGLRRASSAWS